MLAARDSNAEEREANRAAAIAIADQTYAQGIDERDRLFVALQGVETLVPGLEARIIAARATVTDHESLATSLHSLVKLAQEVLSTPQSRAARQLTDGGVNASELNAIETIANAVKSTGEQASGAREREAPSAKATSTIKTERASRTWNGSCASSIAHTNETLRFHDSCPLPLDACSPWAEKPPVKQLQPLP
ncbi:MAG: hypothetical protein IPM54_33450 [Polyangiaceae bacterium]|nr:hypothetical protein [Polyangiaceae bacterium]